MINKIDKRALFINKHYKSRRMSTMSSSTALGGCRHSSVDGSSISRVCPIIIYYWGGNSPQSSITTFFDVFPDLEPTASMAWTTSIPFVTFPNTTCLPEGKGKYF